MHSPVSAGTRRRLISSALAFGLLFCAGCDDKPAAAPGALAVIVGAHSNMVAPSLLDSVKTELDTASDLGSPATVIVDDGNPTASAPLALKTANDNPLYQQDQVKQLKNMIDKTRAGNPEVDVIGPLPTVTVLRDGTVGFVPDQAVLKDPAAARAVLADYAKAIKDGRRALLTGTTASDGTPEYRRQLSEKRAGAVRDLLVGLGAPADRISTRGLGSDFPGYVPDRDAQGNLDPIPAAQNRQVIIELS